LYGTTGDELIVSNDVDINLDAVYARCFSKLSDKDKKEIIDLIEYKNLLKDK